MRFSKAEKRGGFTLVEVIVVLVILAILAAVLIPTLTGYIDKANEKSSIAEARMCVVAAQTLISENYGENKTLIPEYADIISLAEVDGSIKANSVEADGGTLKHLVYEIKDYAVTYCHDTSNCSYHAESYTVTKGEVASDDDSIKAVFAKYNNIRLDSVNISNSSSHVAKLFNSLDHSIQNNLKDKTWYIDKAGNVDPGSSPVRLFFTEKAYSATEDAANIVVYKARINEDGSVSYQKGIGRIDNGVIKDAKNFGTVWKSSLTELG